MFGKYPKLKEIILLFLGLVICIYFIYIRFILKRLPKNVFQDWNPILLAIYVSLLILFVILLRNHIRPPSLSRPAEFIIKNIISPVVSTYKKALAMVYIILDENTPIQQPLHRIIEKCGEFLQHANLSIIGIANIYIFTTLLPRLATLLAMFIDVFLTHQFFYLYKIIWLLTIPLLWNVLLYLLRKQLENQMNWYTRFMDVEIKSGRLICTPKQNSILGNYYQPTEKDYKDITIGIQQHLSMKKLFLDKFKSGSLLFRLNRVYGLNLIIYLGYVIIWADLVILQLIQTF